jgi:hypothetical protein
MVTDRPEGFLISPAPKGHHEIAQGKAKRRHGCVPGFFPTVAWPSEAVRVGDESITFIHKRVDDLYYGSRGARRSVSVCSVVQRQETGDSPLAIEEAILIQSEPKRSVLRRLG